MATQLIAGFVAVFETPAPSNSTILRDDGSASRPGRCGARSLDLLQEPPRALASKRRLPSCVRERSVALHQRRPCQGRRLRGRCQRHQGKVTEAKLTCVVIGMNGQPPLPFLHVAPSQRPAISTCTLAPSACTRSITDV